jgi:hypothetical protein
MGKAVTRLGETGAGETACFMQGSNVKQYRVPGRGWCQEVMAIMEELEKVGIICLAQRPFNSLCKEARWFMEKDCGI